MSFSIVSPFSVFNDLDGTPLENGYIYIGAANLNPETSPIQIYWDAYRTIPAAQPIRTIGGFPSRTGAPANIYVAEDAYSITVRNSRKVLVINTNSAGNQVPSGFPVPGDEVAFVQTGTGAVTRNMQDKVRESVSVKDFGAIGDGATDDANAFKNAIQSLPANGGVLVIPTGNYYLGSNPLTGTTGARSIRYDISEGATFSGPFGAGGTASNSGKFPTCITVGQIIPVGQYITSRTLVDAAPTGAIAAFASEVFDGSSTNTNQRIAVFGGAKLLGQGISSGANFVAQAMAGSSGKVWGLEVNVGTQVKRESPNFATSFGISVNCTSQENITFGLRIDNSSYPSIPGLFNYAIQIRQAIVGLSIESTPGLENGIIVGNPPAVYGNTCFFGVQLANNGNVLLLQSFTKTSSTGKYISAINADNTLEMFGVSTNGQVKCMGLARPSTFVTAQTYTIPTSVTHVAIEYSGTHTITLPAASSFPYREITIKTFIGPVVSSSSNVYPLIGGGLGTAILSGVAGKWATLVSDGTNWSIQMAN